MTTGTCTCGRKGPLYGGGCLRCIQNARTARRVPPHGDAVTSTIAKRLKKFPAADKAAHALVSEYVHRYMGKGLAAVFPRIGTAWERGIHGWAVRNVDTATTIAHFTTRENAEISVVACDQATRPATPARHGDSLGYTTKRYVAGQVGRRHDGRPNYAVSDTMPALGSDGRASDHDTMPDAQKWADELNTRFLHAQRENTREGRIWMEIPHRRGFYAWLVPPPPPRDVWYD